MVWLGFLAGRAFGWTWLESLFAGAVVAISSTTIIAKAFDEQKVRGKLREFVIGVLIAEGPHRHPPHRGAHRAGERGGALAERAGAGTAGRLMAFLLALVVLGLLVIPRAMRAVVRLKSTETTLIAAIGICFGVSLLARPPVTRWPGCLSRRLAGQRVGRGGGGRASRRAGQGPVRRGVLRLGGYDPRPAIIARNWAVVAVLTAVVVIREGRRGDLGAFMTGAGVPTSVQAGMSLAQIGEFILHHRGAGVALGATRSSCTGGRLGLGRDHALEPWLIPGHRARARTISIAGSPRAADLRRALRELDRRAPQGGAPAHPSREGAQAGPAAVHRRPRPGGPRGRLLHASRARPGFARGAVPDGAGGLALGRGALGGAPGGALRRGRGARGAPARDRPGLGGPPRGGGRRVDFAAAPRRMLSAALQITVVPDRSAPGRHHPAVLAGDRGAVAIGALLLALAVGFWRSAKNLQGHVPSGGAGHRRGPGIPGAVRGEGAGAAGDGASPRALARAGRAPVPVAGRREPGGREIPGRAEPPRAHRRDGARHPPGEGGRPAPRQRTPCSARAIWSRSPAAKRRCSRQGCAHGAKGVSGRRGAEPSAQSSEPAMQAVIQEHPASSGRR